MSPLRTPVLLLGFNRPDTTARVLAAIRAVRPARLYFAVDGPRADRPEEEALCAEVRRLAAAVDWPCQMQTLFREENLGCRRGVRAALDWFFSQEPRGIVLEDDCLPSASFFAFCETLLERFAQDPRVFAIQGNFFGSARAPRASYLFSRMFYMWGWASWATRWQAVRGEDLDQAGVQRALDERWLGASGWRRDYWLDVLARQAAGEIDSWGNPVLFHCFAHRLYNVTPARNLVLNIGVGPSATRTEDLDCGPHHQEALEIDFPLVGAQRYEGADDMLSYEHRWRTQLTRWRLLRQVMHYRHPRLYRALRRAFHALGPA